MLALDLGQVAPYQQILDYSCGAAVLKAVLQHWGEYVDELTLIHEIGVDPDHGSTAQQVADAARKRGYQAQAKMFRSIDELGTYTAQDIPVIVAMRSFRRPNQGHFVVATRVDPKHVEIMDPNVRRNRRTLTRSEMDRRWQFRDRTGVLVMPKRKRASFGQGAATGPTSQQKTAWAIAGVLVVLAAATTGVVLYRRRRQQIQAY